MGTAEGSKLETRMRTKAPGFRKAKLAMQGWRCTLSRSRGVRLMTYTDETVMEMKPEEVRSHILAEITILSGGLCFENLRHLFEDYVVRSWAAVLVEIVS